MKIAKKGQMCRGFKLKSTEFKRLPLSDEDAGDELNWLVARVF